MRRCWACLDSGIIIVKQYDKESNAYYNVCYRCSCNTHNKEQVIPMLAKSVEDKIAEINRKEIKKALETPTKAKECNLKG